jgi:hypothetical protein
VRRAHDTHVNLPYLCRDGDPLVLDRELVDRCRLDVVEDLARLGRGELVDERRPGGRLDKRL